MQSPLTVAELIKLLSQMPQDLPVYIYEGAVLGVEVGPGFVLLETDHQGTP